MSFFGTGITSPSPHPSGLKLEQAGCNCEPQLTPAGPCSQLRKMLFHVQMQMTISSLEHASAVFQPARQGRGAGAPEKHLALAVRMNYAAPKFSLNPETGQGSRRGAESRGGVPQVPTQLFLYPIPSASPQDWHHSLIPQDCPASEPTSYLQVYPLQSIPNACCQEIAIITLNSSYWIPALCQSV